MKGKTLRKQALLFIILLGVISLLSDFTHEGARSIYGPFLGILGVSAFIVSFTAGLGEFIGQALRILTGIIADKTKRYWFMMIIGYMLNLLAIPLLMFVQPSIWYVAIILILLERVGKGIRAPAKSALASFTAPHLGAGKAFAIQEVMDQLGAFLGPLLVFFVLRAQGSNELYGFQLSFGILGIFSIVTLAVLVFARFKYPNPDQFEIKTIEKGFHGNKAFIWYMVAISLLAMGFIDFPLLSFHIEQTSSINIDYVPLLYSIAMGVDAIAALIFGTLFDKIGSKSLQVALGIAAFSTPIFFLVPGTWALVLGIMLWGLGMGAQESVLKSVIATIVSKEKRATAYGIFNSVFGLAWFIGSAIIGLLYLKSILAVVIFSAFFEVASIVLISVFRKKQREYNT